MNRARARLPLPAWVALTLLTALSAGASQHAGAEEAKRLPPPSGLADSAARFRTRWLPRHQRADGSWSSRDWDLFDLGVERSRRTRLPGRATADHDLTSTALATYAFLGNGFTDRGGHPYADVVRRALGWLVDRQRADGGFGRPGDKAPAHASAHAALAVVEHHALTKSPATRESARRAVTRLLATQDEDGSWHTRGRADALRTLWSCMVLRSAQGVRTDGKSEAGDPFSPDGLGKAIGRAARWFDTRTDPETGVVGVRHGDPTSDGATTEVLTAAGAWVRMARPRDTKSDPLLGRNAAEDGRRFQRACAWLQERPPTTEPGLATSDGLYWWIGSSVMREHGLLAWRKWSDTLGRHVADAQHKRGTFGDLKGSWDPQGSWGTSRGRVAMTAAASLAMTVYYIYDQVFGDLMAAGARIGAARPTPRLELQPGRLTWRRSSRAIHDARFLIPEGGSLPIQAAHIRASVHGLRAQVVLDLYLTNTTAEQQEGGLDLRLPDGAQPYYLAFGEAVLARMPDPASARGFATDLASLRERHQGEWGLMREARMAPVKSATRAFETIVAQRKDPALLTWHGAGMYHLRVFPLLPGKQHRVTLAYDVDLSLVGNEAELRLGVPSDIPEVRVALEARGAGVDLAPDATNERGVRTWRNPKTEALRVRIDASGDHWIHGRDPRGRAHTAGWVRPNVPEIPREARPRAEFLLDVSQSVRPDQIQAWRTLVPAILEANRDRIEEFAVVFFDMATRRWREGFTRNTPETVAALREALDALEPGGATDLAGALASLGESDVPSDVFLFTDGLATWGPKTSKTVSAALHGPRTLFPYAVGIGPEDRRMLGALADHTGGSLVTVLGPADIHAAARASRFHSFDLQAVGVEDLTDLLVSGDPRRVHPGQRLRLAARGAPTKDSVLFLRLRRGDQEHVVRTPITTARRAPGAWRVYGTEGVQRLEEAGPEHAALALDYAMHFRIVRRSCALVMLETEAMYERFGLTTTGHGRRAADKPIHSVLGHDGRREPDVAPFSLPTYARARGIPEALLRALTPTDRAQAVPPLPSEEILRQLGSELESKPGLDAMRRIAVHLLAHEHPGHVVALLRTLPSEPDSVLRPELDWLLARAAVEADRPQLALVAFEAALGEHSHDGGAGLWVIAADYERFLQQLSSEKLPIPLASFVRRRLASLERWRDGLGAFALPTEADLVVLHVPTDRHDQTIVEAEGVALSGQRGFALGSRAHAPQALIVPTLPTGAWSVRLKRPPYEPAPGTRLRALALVIRDWGRPTERVVVRRSIGATDKEQLLSGEGASR